MLSYFKKLFLLFWFCQSQLIFGSEDLYYKTILVEQQLVHTVTVNPKKYKIINTTAQATGENIDFLSNIARKYSAIAAINGGFFREVDHNLFVPAGPLKIANVWHGIAYQPRAAIGWKADGDLVLIDRLKTKTLVQIGGLNLPVYYFNPHYHASYQNNQYQDNKYIDNKAVLYSSIYPDFLNLENKYPNILIKQNDEDNYIYRISNSIKSTDIAKANLELAKVSVSVIPQLEPDTTDLWQTVDYITSGAPVLIKNYDLLSNYAQEKISYQFVNSQHARTAVCILENGFWKFVVASSMTIPELANTMQILQCRDAINLDGGSSSSMYLSLAMRSDSEFPSIVNPIVDAILVLPK
ncbi:MAG: phosphodiester glycosidase family protein [Gammaproteobacteria bacterium]|jgi:uncharacterized protein YigE (DUF2233 family)